MNECHENERSLHDYRITGEPRPPSLYSTRRYSWGGDLSSVPKVFQRTISLKFSYGTKYTYLYI